MGVMLALSVFEDETARYSGGFRVMRAASLGVAACGGRALALRAEPPERVSALRAAIADAGVRFIP